MVIWSNPRLLAENCECGGDNILRLEGGRWQFSSTSSAIGTVRRASKTTATAAAASPSSSSVSLPGTPCVGKSHNERPVISKQSV